MASLLSKIKEILNKKKESKQQTPCPYLGECVTEEEYRGYKEAICQSCDNKYKSCRTFDLYEE